MQQGHGLLQPTLQVVRMVGLLTVRHGAFMLPPLLLVVVVVLVRLRR
jgi:hypothetical protein